jgi:hypothetical protein
VWPLAEAWTADKALRRITLSVKRVHASHNQHSKAILGAATYEAFGGILHVNTLASIWRFLLFFDDAVGDERIVDSRNRMRIE